jgi:hypothetical protein
MSSVDPTKAYVSHTGELINLTVDNGELLASSKNGSIDENNSTHTPLLAGATFTGTAIDILKYSIIYVTAFSDVGSAEDGLIIEQGHSENGPETIHWDSDDKYTITANKGEVFAINPTLQYMRVRYINGAADQTEFRIHVITKTKYSLPRSHRLKDNLSLQADADLTKSVILQEHPDGTVKNVDTLHPMAVDGHVIFSKDLNLDVSDNYGFSGSITDYFDSLETVNNDASATNPKQILLWFQNTVYASAIGFGCDDLTKSFSNQVIKFLGSGQVVRSTWDDSSDNTKHNSRLVRFGPTAFNGLLLEFHTTDEIGLSNITIRKEQKTVSQIQALNPSGEVISVDATNGGNLKVSVEELESGISVNSNSQLRVTPFDSSGGELGTVTNPNNVSLPSTNFDAFGRFSVAAPHKLFETGATQAIDTIRYHDTSEVGGGTVVRNATKTHIELTTTTASGDKAIYQTRRNIQYNKANAQEIFVIYKPNPITNRRERWGYFNDNNGVFFEHDGTDPRLVIRSDTSGSVVDTTIERASWDDKLDGTGESGLTIDFTKQTVFKIDFGWLSSRGVRFFADINGNFVLVKQWYISNTLDVPFMAAATLPIRFEVENTGVTAQTQTSAYSCCAVQSSGSAAQEGAIRFLSNGVSASSVNTTETIISGVRLNSSYVDRGSIQPIKVGLLPASGTTFAHYRVRYNPTLTGGTWTTASEGIYDYLSVMPSSFSGGSIIAEGTLSLGNKNQVSAASFRDVLNDVYLGSDISGNADSLVLTMETDSGTGSIFYNYEIKEFT